jgi:hypothetical protein
LTEEEQELAAQSSYSYWLFSKRRHPAQNACATDELNGDSNTSGAAFRLRLAMREARRHLVAENDDFTLALDRLRGACHYRKVKHKKLDFRFQMLALKICLALAGSPPGYCTDLF